MSSRLRLGSFGKKNCPNLGRGFFKETVLIEDLKKERDWVLLNTGHFFRECNLNNGVKCKFSVETTDENGKKINICKKETKFVENTKKE